MERLRNRRGGRPPRRLSFCAKDEQKRPITAEELDAGKSDARSGALRGSTRYRPAGDRCDTCLRRDPWLLVAHTGLEPVSQP